MKVKQLIEFLEKMDPNLKVWISTDAEGNSYDTIHAIDECYVAQDGREAWVLSDEDLREDSVLYEKTEKAVVIWP